MLFLMQKVLFHESCHAALRAWLLGVGVLGQAAEQAVADVGMLPDSCTMPIRLFSYMQQTLLTLKDVLFCCSLSASGFCCY